MTGEILGWFWEFIGQPEMVNCTRCFLHRSMRVVNLIVNICGIGMIIYSLWLLKKWQDGVAELLPVSSVPRPWYFFFFFSGFHLIIPWFVFSFLLYFPSYRNVSGSYFVSSCSCKFAFLYDFCCIYISQRKLFFFIRFIYTCLAVGMAISLSSLSGHMVANCISNYTLCIVSSSNLFVTFHINNILHHLSHQKR